MTTRELNKKHPIAFFALIYAISLPFWLISFFLDNSGLPDNIPMSDIGATLSPTIAACILIYQENGKSGLQQFLQRVVDYRRVTKKIWLITAIIFLPALYVVTYAAMQLAKYPLVQHVHVSLGLLAVLAMFLVAATVEELGYSAYATDALQTRFEGKKGQR